ncbi:hypothetical protein Tco_1196734 [Tanacetum coccineum]
MGEGSGQPTDPQHTFTSTKLSNKEQITVSSSFRPKKTYTHRKLKKVTKIPQSSEPTHLVTYKAVYEEMYDSVERAATIATSLDAEQDNSKDLILLVKVNAVRRELTTAGEISNTTEVKKVNGETVIHALIDGKRIVVSETTIISALQFGDEGGVECLLNSTIFEEIARMGYEKPSQKLTFYKAFFSPQWKFMIHTILQCLSVKTTTWNEFSSTMASAIICLATNQKFNFSKFILEGGGIANIDEDADITLVDEVEGRRDEMMFDVEKDLAGEEVIIEEFAKDLNEDEVTLAPTLQKLKSTTPKAKGVVIREPSDTHKTVIPKQKNMDKGKGKMIKPKRPLKVKDQISFDE